MSRRRLVVLLVIAIVLGIGIGLILPPVVLHHPRPAPHRQAVAATWPPPDGLRVVFLGDSITHDGRFVRTIDAYLATRFPDRTVEVINLGLSSETASGQAESGHPDASRPDVHERLGRVLEQARPDLVFVCYGMNDGAYAPPDPERAAAFRRGIESVVAAIRATGAAVIVGTPPPFDPVPIRDRTQPLSAATFNFVRPFEGYDGVLGGYTDLILAHREPPASWTVADIHGQTRVALDALRVDEPTLTFAGDGVHPDGNGHLLIALAYLAAWNATDEVDVATIDAARRAVVRGRVEIAPPARPDDGSLRFAWTTRIPMPHYPAWDPRLVALVRLDERLNRHRLTVSGLAAPRYALFEGESRLGEVARGELADGVDLLRFPELSTNRRAAEVGRLVARRRSTLDPSWLAAVGHGPPELPPAIPLDDARQRADRISTRIANLTKPVPIDLRLVPVGP